ncbi:hypothetical protein ACT7DB_17530 [Bacillus cereus]
MTSIDIRFCEELIKFVGERLYMISKQEEYASSADGLFEKFKDSNDWATNQIKKALAEKYPLNGQNQSLMLKIRVMQNSKKSIGSVMQLMAQYNFYKALILMLLIYV